MLQRGKFNSKLIIKMIKILILIFIILCFVLGVVSFSNKGKNDLLEQLEYINDDNQWNDEEYPYMSYMLFIEYAGNLSAENMVKSMSHVANYVIPKYYKELKNASEAKILKYYNKNYDAIQVDIGINESEDFKDLILSIQSLETDELIFSSYRVNKDEIKTRTGYTETTFYITYEENEEIGFNVKIYNKVKQNSSSLVYTALENEQDNENQNSSEIENESALKDE